MSVHVEKTLALHIFPLLDVKIYISHTAGIFFPWKKFPPEGNCISRWQFPFRSEVRVEGTCRREIRFPRVEIFPREENAGRVGRYFPLWKYKFPWICTNFCPALIAQLVECLATEPRVPGSNPVSC